MSKPKLSDKEIQTKRQELLDKAENITGQISKMSPHLLKEDGKEFTRFVEYVNDLSYAFIGFDNCDVPAHVVSEHRRDVSQVVYKSGTHKVVCGVVTSRLTTRKDVTQVEDVTMTTSISQMEILVRGLVGYSCHSDDVTDYMTKDSDFLPTLVHTLDAGHTPHLDNVLSETQDDLLLYCMYILDNCALIDKNIARVRDIGTVKVVQPYLNSHKGDIQLSSLQILARLVNEKEAENLLTSHVTIFTLLIQRLDKAWHSSTHSEDWGNHVTELTKTVRHLARNDVNKQVLVEVGCLPILVEILDSQYNDEVLDSLKALWVLSFDDVNKQKMVEERHLVKRVWRKYSDVSSDNEIKKLCYGILWSLIDQLKRAEKLKYVGIATKIEFEKSRADMELKQQSQQQAQKKTPDGVSFAGHVMLSYHWGHQKTILQICQKLKEEGVPVWIDVDFMGGSTLETMAKAVEKCSIFIMAVSKAYKESSNTRLEAGYAQNLKKPIIPLMMEKGYKPDGWLGILMESKMYYEFSGKDTFNAKMPKLLEEIKNTIGQDIIGDTKEKPESSSLVAKSGQEQPTERNGGITMTVICNVL